MSDKTQVKDIVEQQIVGIITVGAIAMVAMLFMPASYATDITIPCISGIAGFVVGRTSAK